jgi:DNA-binding NtrC family response regulator
VVLDHPTVSRNHLVVRRQGEQFLVQDLGSTNGTFIDGAQVKEGFLRAGALLEVGDVQLRFQAQVKSLEVSPAASNRLGDLVGGSVPMRQIFALISRIAPTDSTLLLIGETGCGKGAAARTIHKLSPRATGPFVVFDCASVSENLIESELFGHEKGAFTGAVAQRVGCLERANGGMLFLDEIDDLPLDLQPKLLRALEDREFRRLGQSGGAHKFDTRVVAASKKDLWGETQAGRFREDLYFRLSVITIQLPPLRQRREDIPHIIKTALSDPEILQRHGRKIFSPAAMSILTAYSWPGNIRELMNVISHVLTFSEGEEIDTSHLPARVQGQQKEQPLPFNEHLSFKDAKEQLLENFEREYIGQVLKRCDGNISRAARESGLHRKSIERLVKKYALDAKAMKVKV